MQSVFSQIPAALDELEKGKRIGNQLQEMSNKGGGNENFLDPLLSVENEVLRVKGAVEAKKKTSIDSFKISLLLINKSYFCFALDS